MAEKFDDLLENLMFGDEAFLRLEALEQLLEKLQILERYKNKVYTMRELLGFVPEDIRDVATFTWEELNEIFR